MCCTCTWANLLSAVCVSNVWFVTVVFGLSLEGMLKLLNSVFLVGARGKRDNSVPASILR